MPRLGIVAQNAHFARLGGLRRDGRIDHLVEGTVELVDHLVPGDVALGDAVELLLYAGREVVVDDRAELLLQVIVDHHADVGRRKSVFLFAVVFREGLRGDLFARERQLCVVALLPVPVLFDDVAAVDDRGDRRGVGRRTADAQLFEALDQRGFVVACRRLCEVLILFKLLALYRHIFFKRRELCGFFFLCILALNIKSSKAFKINIVSRRLENVFFSRNFSLCGFLNTIRHL